MDIVNQDVEAVIVIRVHQVSGETDANGYPLGYFEATYGSFANDPLERGDQGAFEIRDVIE